MKSQTSIAGSGTAPVLDAPTALEIDFDTIIAQAKAQSSPPMPTKIPTRLKTVPEETLALLRAFWESIRANEIEAEPYMPDKVTAAWAERRDSFKMDPLNAKKKSPSREEVAEEFFKRRHALARLFSRTKGIEYAGVLQGALRGLIAAVEADVRERMEEETQEARDLGLPVPAQLSYGVLGLLQVRHELLGCLNQANALRAECESSQRNGAEFPTTYIPRRVARFLDIEIP